MTNAAVERVARARARAAAAGRRIPRTMRAVPRQLYPQGAEAEYTRILRGEVREWGAEVLAAIAAEYPRLAATAAADRAAAAERRDAISPLGPGGGGWAGAIAQMLADLLASWGRRATRLQRDVDRIAVRVADHNREQVNGQFRAVLGVDVIGAEPWLRDELHATGVANARLITNVGERTAARVEAIVADGVRAGTSTKAIKNQVKETLGSTDQRARLIARDQVGKLNGDLTRVRQQNAGVTHYRWRGKLDRRERLSHRTREGQTFSWDEPPADGHPGQAVQCRCNAEPVLDLFADLMPPPRQAPDWEAIGKPPTERRRGGSEYDLASYQAEEARRRRLRAERGTPTAAAAPAPRRGRSP